MEIAVILTEEEPPDHCERAFQNVLNQIGRPTRPESTASILRLSNPSVHLCHPSLDFGGDFGNAQVFQNQIRNHRALFEPRHLIHARSQKFETDDILH
jgi:hypothetical protein